MFKHYYEIAHPLWLQYFQFLFSFHDLLHHVVHTSDYTVLNGTINGEWRTEKDASGNSHGLIKYNTKISLDRLRKCIKTSVRRPTVLADTQLEVQGINFT
jgi:hypothetical protein